MEKITKKILLTGGGSGGPVSPLLAIAEELNENPDFEFLWLGTKTGPERSMVNSAGLKFRAIPAGKLRRYFSWYNFIDIIKIIAGFFVSLYIILSYRPSLMMSAGGYVSVPIAWASWLLRVPIMIHQQDLRPGLANKLMSKFSNVITVTFEASLSDYGEQAIWTGNPIRKNVRGLPDKKQSRIMLGFKNELPLILVVGGGTGALAINTLIESIAEELTKDFQIILITGKSKSKYFNYPKHNFKSFEFLNSIAMSQALSSADIVISRAGMGLLSELAYLKKPSIIIPIPDSHQEDNATVLYENNAALVLDQNETSPEKLLEQIRIFFADKNLMSTMGNNLHSCVKSNDGKEIIRIINNL